MKRRIGKEEGSDTVVYVADCPVCLSRATATGDPKKEDVTIICTVCEACWEMTPEEWSNV